MPDELIGLVACVLPIVAFVVWMAWLTRRPSRNCPRCELRVALNAAVCPACGAPLDQSPPPPAEQPRQEAAPAAPPEDRPPEAPSQSTKKKGKKLKR